MLLFTLLPVIALASPDLWGHPRVRSRTSLALTSPSPFTTEESFFRRRRWAPSEGEVYHHNDTHQFILRTTTTMAPTIPPAVDAVESDSADLDVVAARDSDPPVWTLDPALLDTMSASLPPGSSCTASDLKFMVETLLTSGLSGTFNVRFNSRHKIFGLAFDLKTRTASLVEPKPGTPLFNLTTSRTGRYIRL